LILKTQDINHSISEVPLIHTHCPMGHSEAAVARWLLTQALTLQLRAICKPARSEEGREGRREQGTRIQGAWPE